MNCENTACPPATDLLGTTECRDCAFEPITPIPAEGVDMEFLKLVMPFFVDVREEWFLAKKGRRGLAEVRAAVSGVEEFEAWDRASDEAFLKAEKSL